MSPHKQARKTALVLALALGAMAPAAASARLNLNPVGPSSPLPNVSAKSTEGNTPSPRPTVRIVRVSAPGGFDWGDAGVGAAAAFGLLMLAGAGRSVAAGRHRRTAAASGTGHGAILR